ncbi:MAG: tetratricopeptide repeat protein [Bryobacteraceae bacterium]
MLAAVCAFITPLNARELQSAATPRISRLGTVSFPISCKPTVEASFNRGIALLDSFGYPAAEAQFKQIEAEDPKCAMAYWGEAMTIWHQLWDRPSKGDLRRGSALIGKAEAIGGKTKREREYIQAAAAFYANDPKATYDTRTAAYSQTLRRLHEHFPNDDVATDFYALSLLASPEADKNDFAYRKKAVSILEGVFSRRPNDPGAAHYLIHACDNPEMAKQGLPAARRYAQIAPASPHALHMPSHIFARLGMWQEDIHSNLASKKAAEQQHDQADRLHAMDFLEYAYLQLGEWAQAKSVEEEAIKVRKQDFSNKRMQPYFFYVQVHFPSLYGLETKDWKKAYALSVPENAGPDFQAVIYWARVIAATHLHELKAAREAVHEYDLALAAVRKTSYAYVADEMAPQRDEAHAWLAFAEGKSTEATSLLRSVADKQDQTGKGEVEIPARGMLADMLLQLDRPGDALKQYALSLKTDPNRLNSLYGAARAAELAQEPAQAKKYYKELLAGREQGLLSRNPELVHARAYLSHNHRDAARN